MVELMRLFSLGQGWPTRRIHHEAGDKLKAADDKTSAQPQALE